MKLRLATYTFSAATRQVTLTGVTAIEQLAAIVNVTRGADLYLAGEPGLGFTNFANGIVTLQADTTAMADADKLLILIEGAPDLPAGASTAARQDTGNASLASMDAKLPTLSSGRVPVSLGADAINVTVTSEVEVKNDTGNPVPVSAAQSGTWTFGQLPASLGAKAASASLSVTLATDGAFVSGVGAPGDGAAASDTASASLISLVKRALGNWTTLLARIPVLGQALRAGSLPVTIASDQGALGTVALTAGSAAIGTVQVSNNLNAAAVRVQGGNAGLNGKILSAASTNSTLVKSGGGALNSVQVSNSGTGWAYVKFYNKASAPVVGTDSPVAILGIPPGGARVYEPNAAVYFDTGIAYAITGGPADNDTAAVTAGQVVGSLTYG